jgi:hypothetical protein
MDIIIFLVLCGVIAGFICMSIYLPAYQIKFRIDKNGIYMSYILLLLIPISLHTLIPLCSLLLRFFGNIRIKKGYEADSKHIELYTKSTPFIYKIHKYALKQQGKE